MPVAVTVAVTVAVAAVAVAVVVVAVVAVTVAVAVTMAATVVATAVVGTVPTSCQGCLVATPPCRWPAAARTCRRRRPGMCSMAAGRGRGHVPV